MSVIHTFTWRMFHPAQAYGATVEEARQRVLNARPAWIPEGTELRYVCSRGSAEEIAKIYGAGPSES